MPRRVPVPAKGIRDHRSVRVRRDPHPARPRQGERRPARHQADRPGRRPHPRDARPLPRTWTRPRSTTSCSASSARSATRAPTSPGSPALAAGLPDTVAGVQDEPLLRLGPGGRQPGRAEGPLRLGGPGPRRRRRVDVPGADGLRRRRLGDGPETNLRHRLRAAGHRRRPDRHPRGLHPRRRRRVRGRSPRTRAAKAWKDGHFDRSVVPVTDRNGLVVLDHDEHLRPGTTAESLARPASRRFAGIGDMGGFDAVALQKYHWVERIDHVHHAGNSSGIVDGAALVADRHRGGRRALRPHPARPDRRRRRLRLRARPSCSPAPRPATRKALAKAGLTIDDIDLVEINEAFAAVVLRFVRDMGLSTWTRSTSTAAPSRSATRSAPPAR